MSDSPERVHFPGFNGVRFVAASAVVIYHVEQFRSACGLPNHSREVGSLGPQGVSVFFVLSGFLIAYLLLREREVTGGIAIGRFYARRALRILPLYYTIVIIAFVVAPLVQPRDAGAVATWLRHENVLLQPDYGIRLAMFLVLVPNVAVEVFRPVLHASQAWSIGVEEQFYLFFPWFVRLTRGRVELLVIPAAIKLLVVLWLREAIQAGHRELTPLFFGIFHFKLECFAAGAVAAALVARRSPLLGWLVRREIQALAAPLLVLLLAFGDFAPGATLLTPVATALLLLNMSQSKLGLLNLEGRVLDRLGKLSYGIYMYQTLGIAGALLLAERLGGLPALAVHAIALAATTAIAFASYHGFERRFLRQKERFAIIPSG